jgi:phosphoesterase RecJ-like protein
VLTSHARPDGDAIGSVLACAQIVRALGTRADVVMSDRVPPLYRNLPQAESVIQASAINGNYDAAIILECDHVGRTRLQGLERRFLINIDHHTTGKPFADVNWIDPTACATAEMIYELAQHAGVKVTPEMATCLYTAVLTDTGSFCFAGTNQRTFALAEELVRRGAEPVAIAQGIYFANPFSKTLLLGAALSNLQREGTLAWMHVTRADMARSQASEEDCEGLVNYALGNAGIEVAAFFRELENTRWRVSLRSKGAVDVAMIAQQFGGGGHECAAGFSVPGSLEEVRTKILGQLRCGLGKVGL